MFFLADLRRTSRLTSFSAAQVVYSVESLSSNESALLGVTAGSCGVVVATGLAITASLLSPPRLVTRKLTLVLPQYIRFQPPTASKLWGLVPQVISCILVGRFST